MTLQEFKELISRQGHSITETQDGLVVSGWGYVDLSGLKTLPEGTKFENQGYVDLESLTTLPEGIKFENQGNVWLDRLTALPPGTEFKNQGSVFLIALRTLPPGVKFENQGYVYLDSLTTDPIQYLGETVKFKLVDGYTMLVGHKQDIGGVSVMRARYFEGGAYEDMTRCFVAELDGLHAHGESKEDAIRDVRFKKAQRDFDATDLVNQITQRGSVTIEDYRLLTGACELGCRQFLTDHDINPDELESLPLEKVLELTADAYGGQEFAEHFEGEAV